MIRSVFSSASQYCRWLTSSDLLPSAISVRVGVASVINGELLWIK
jgi:hypothetical protein